MILNDEQEEILNEMLETERELLYKGWSDTVGICPPAYKVKQVWRDKKTVVIMDLNEWEIYAEAVKELLQVLEYARERIEYLENSNKTDNISFDDFVRKEVLSYDTDVLEKVRDRFEEQFREPGEEPER